VLDGNQTRSDFFLCVHTGETEDEALRWFFDAEEVVRHSRKSKDGKTFTLKLHDADSFQEQRRSHEHILNRLSRGVSETNYFHSRQQQIFVTNLPAASLLSDSIRTSLSENAMDILSRLRWLDVPLIKRLAQFALYVDEYAYVLPFADVEAHPDGVDDAIELHFEVDRRTTIANAEIDVRFSDHPRCNVLLGNRALRHLKIIDVDGEEHVFLFCEGYGYATHCIRHSGCKAEIFNITCNSFWGERKETWTKAPRRAMIDEQWKTGLLGQFFDAADWLCLEQCGIVISYEAVHIPWQQIARKNLQLGETALPISSECSLNRLGASYKDGISAIEFSRGGAEIVRALDKVVVNDVYSSMVNGLVQEVNNTGLT